MGRGPAMGLAEYLSLRELRGRIFPQKVGGEGPKCIEPASPRPRLAAASMPLRPLDREVRCERTPMARAVEESGERTKLAGVRPGAKKSQRRTFSKIGLYLRCHGDRHHHALPGQRSEEHTSELQSTIHLSYDDIRFNKQ